MTHMINLCSLRKKALLKCVCMDLGACVVGRNPVKAEQTYPPASEGEVVRERLAFCLLFPFGPAKLKEWFSCHVSSPLSLFCSSHFDSVPSSDFYSNLMPLREICTAAFLQMWWWKSYISLLEMTSDFLKTTAKSGSETSPAFRLTIYWPCVFRHLCSVTWDEHPRCLEIWYDYLPR